ncbi:fibroblast growth factor receptor-like 1 [Ptychodera flava]|uniref:fibroblast growth factor receptor-like 1 n=1 Tax=Ptychodera flava TaxID=63121 RepID=UPI00396A36D5
MAATSPTAALVFIALQLLTAVEGLKENQVYRFPPTERRMAEKVLLKCARCKQLPELCLPCPPGAPNCVSPQCSQTGLPPSTAEPPKVSGPVINGKMSHYTQTEHSKKLNFVIGGSATVHRRVTVFIECPVTNKGKHDIRWKKDNMSIVDGEGGMQIKKKGGTLKIRITKVNTKTFTGTYTCVVGSASEDFHLTVSEERTTKDDDRQPPKVSGPVINGKMSRYTQTEHSKKFNFVIGGSAIVHRSVTVFIECPVTNKGKHDIRWKKDNMSIVDGEGGMQIKKKDGTLKIHKVNTKTSTGTYTCVVGSASEDFHLTVSEERTTKDDDRHKSEPSSEKEADKTDDRAKDGEDKIRLVADGGSRTVHQDSTVLIRCPIHKAIGVLKWQKNHADFIGRQRGAEIRPDGKLQLRNVRLDDSAVYTCAVRNKKGRLNLTVIPTRKGMSHRRSRVHNKQKNKAADCRDQSSYCKTTIDNINICYLSLFRRVCCYSCSYRNDRWTNIHLIGYSFGRL